MKNTRDSMIFYRSFYEAIKELSNEQQGQLYNSIFTYSLDFIEPELTGICKTIWTLIKPQLDANIKKYKNGKKPKAKQNTSKTQAKAKQDESKTQANVNVNVNENDNQNENDNANDSEFGTPTQIEPPSIEQVKSYFEQRTKNKTEAQNFFDYWSASNWCNHLGASINWQQKAISWIGKIDKNKQFTDQTTRDPYAKKKIYR